MAPKIKRSAVRKRPAAKARLAVKKGMKKTPAKRGRPMLAMKSPRKVWSGQTPTFLLNKYKKQNGPIFPS